MKVVTTAGTLSYPTLNSPINHGFCYHRIENAVRPSGFCPVNPRWKQGGVAQPPLSRYRSATRRALFTPSHGTTDVRILAAAGGWEPLGPRLERTLGSHDIVRPLGQQ